MGDGTEFDDALLGLPGFRVRVTVGMETIRRAAGFPPAG
jgi:hypothetical protein